MDHIFLYQQWLHQRLQEHESSSKPPRLRGRDIALSTSQYGAALMQAYLGKASQPVWSCPDAGLSWQSLPELDS